ncbi:hypothetical protein ACL02R_07270 [Streptomyces sp. MS19]|uniref:hypothetical protein n=1 Tax=Streptomyces sp. MS19 TaxID=3385972 RepID=UPI0039A14257
MGVCIEVLIADFAHLRAAPADRRGELLGVAAFGDPDDPDFDPPEGWSRPEGATWYERYEFRGTLTSYKPHFWAGERWDRMRHAVAPGLRLAFDEFSAHLFWGEHNWDGEGADPPFTPSVPPRAERWGTDTLLSCPPGDVAVFRRHWTRVEPELPSLRPAFDTYADADPAGWIPDFAAFEALVAAWGDVVTRAAGRGWGIIGLRC